MFGIFCSSMHCFEGPEWNYLKRGRESYARGPIVKADPQGRCGGALVYDLQMIVLKAAQVRCLFFPAIFSNNSRFLTTWQRIFLYFFSYARSYTFFFFFSKYVGPGRFWTVFCRMCLLSIIDQSSSNSSLLSDFVKKNGREICHYYDDEVLPPCAATTKD